MKTSLLNTIILLIGLTTFNALASEGPNKEETAKWLSGYSEREGRVAIHVYTDKYDNRKDGDIGVLNIDASSCKIKLFTPKSEYKHSEYRSGPNCTGERAQWTDYEVLSRKCDDAEREVLNCTEVVNLKDVYTEINEAQINIKCRKGKCVEVESNIKCYGGGCGEEYRTGIIKRNSGRLGVCNPPMKFRDMVRAEKFKKGMDHMIKLCGGEEKDLF